MRKRTQEEFLELAKEVHGDRYDYSEAVYTHAHGKVKIHCKLHGPFEQSANTHIRGAGCIPCANKVTTSYTKKDLEYYIPKLTELHKDKYDFSDFGYVNSKTKGNVLCKVCDTYFKIDMEHLLRGQGCNNCGTGGYKPNVSCSLYVIAIDDDYLKCGISVEVPRRLAKLKRSCRLDNFKPLYAANFEFAWQAKQLEDILKSSFEHSVLSSEDLTDGFTETYRMEDLCRIMETVSRFSSECAISFQDLNYFNNVTSE